MQSRDFLSLFAAVPGFPGDLASVGSYTVNSYFGQFYTVHYSSLQDFPGNPSISAILGGSGTLTIAAVPGRGTGGVPEPSSWAMLILGFGVVGSVARRRGGVTRAAARA